MKYITFDLPEGESSGKHKFMSRLRIELAQRGYTSPPEGELPHIHLYTRKWNPEAGHNVYRIDGICINSAVKNKAKHKTCKTVNSDIRDKLMCASGVVFQNSFCKQTVDAIIGPRYRANACIVNGADPAEFDVSPMESERPYFLALCKWRPHKRLSAIVNGFIHADIKGIDLLVLGDTGVDIEHPNVIYGGWRNKHQVAAALKGCISSVHLSWLDWCPNSVVESLVAGKQVIHTTSGGTPILVKDRGYAVQDEVWPFEIHDLYHSPQLNMDKVAEAYRKAYENPIENFDTSDLHISKIADEYVEFFEKVSKMSNQEERKFQQIVQAKNAKHKPDEEVDNE